MPAPSVAQLLSRHLEPTLSMLRESVDSSSEDAWLSAGDGNLPIWEHVLHAAGWLDIWLRTPDEPFVAPPFMSDATLAMRPDATLPVPRETLRQYVQQVSARCRALLAGASDEKLLTEVLIRGHHRTLADCVLSQIRHVQHHVGCISAILRRRTGRGIDWLGYDPQTR